MNINDLSTENKPREKLISGGTAYLSDSELLQILLGTGIKNFSVDKVADAILSKCLYSENILHLSIQELLKVPGLGKAKAALIVAAIELGIRLISPKSRVGKVIKTPKDIYEVLKMDLVFKQQENLYLLSLDSRNKLISKDLINIGGLTYLSVSPREILFNAFKRNAAAIIIAHNHPSGDPTPSTEDIKVTDRIKQACSFVEIPLIDHVVLGSDRFISLKALGLLDIPKNIDLKVATSKLKGGENFESL